MTDIMTIPAIAAIVYTIIDITKTACGGDESSNASFRSSPLLLGAIIGRRFFYVVPGG